MCSILGASNRPAAWTLEQPASYAEAEAAVNSCEFRSSETNVTDFSSTSFQEVSGASIENNGLAIPDTSTSPEGGMSRCLVKIEARFANKLTGVSVWKTSTGLLVSPELVVTGSEAVYDAEYHLGVAKQVTCYIGHLGRGPSDAQPRYGQRVVFSADWAEDSGRRSRDIAFIQVAQPPTLSVETAPTEERPVEQAPATVTAGTNYASEETQVPEPIAQPEPVSNVTQTEAPVHVCVEPPVKEPEFEFPVPAAEPIPEVEIPIPAAEPVSENDYVNVEIIKTPDTSVPEESHPFYETIKTISQIDTKTLDIESSLIDDVGQFVSVVAGSLVYHVTGAETISSGKSTKLPGVSERALLAEASLQAVLAIEQSEELDEVVASMKQNWTANAPEVDQLSQLLAPYLAEAARCIIEYHEGDDIEQTSTAKSLKRRNLGIRQFPANESTMSFIKGLFGPTLLLPGREDVFSSLGPVLRSAVTAVGQIASQAGKTAVSETTPKLLEKYKGATPSTGDVQATRVLVQRAIMADVAYQVLSNLPQKKLQALKVIPIDAEIPQVDIIFDFIKYVIQKVGPSCLHDAKQAVHKFMPLLLNLSTTAVPAKAGSSKLALRDFLSSNKGSVKTF